MVKEFQQLRKQMVQILLKQQEQEQEKKRLFLDIIKVIELIEKKEEIAVRTLKLETVANENLPVIYNNIKRELIKLLAKYEVQPILGESIFNPTEFNQKTSMKEGVIYPKVKYSYLGKILNDKEPKNKTKTT